MNVKEGEGERAQAGGGVRYNAFCITNRMINHTICIITTRKNEFSHMLALVAPTSGRCRLQRFLEELVLLLKTHAAEREGEGQLTGQWYCEMKCCMYARCPRVNCNIRSNILKPMR